MSDFTQSHFAQVVETAKENGETLAKGIELCFGQPCTIEAGEAAPLPETGERDETFEQPGLVVGMRAGETGLVALLPESFPLPEWYKQPDETELSRMQTLGMEWSMCLFPEELMADEYTAAAFPSLNEAIQLLTPDAEAQWLPLTVTIEGAETPGVMYLLGAVQQPCFTPEAEQADEAESASTESGEQQTPSEELLEGEFSLEERQHRAAHPTDDDRIDDQCNVHGPNGAKCGSRPTSVP